MKVTPYILPDAFSRNTTPICCLSSILTSSSRERALRMASATSRCMDGAHLPSLMSFACTSILLSSPSFPNRLPNWELLNGGLTTFPLSSVAAYTMPV